MVNTWKLQQFVVPMTLMLALVAVAPATGGAQQAAEAAANSADRHPALLDPALAHEQAPDTFRVKVATTKGDFVIEIIREWAPHGADRFFNLVKIGFYTDARFFRVIAGFMAQVGYHPDPRVSAAWADARIPDDPIVQPNTRGTVTFAMSSKPNTRTTQFFVNYADNSYLSGYGAFAPFGRVVSGMEVVDALYAGYGEGAPQGNGPAQARIFREGNEYLNQEFPLLDSITRIVVVGE